MSFRRDRRINANAKGTAPAPRPEQTIAERYPPSGMSFHRLVGKPLPPFQVRK